MVMEGLATSEHYNLARFVSEQPPYNLLDRRIENELVPLAQRYGLALLPWSPLAGGILAGRYANQAEVPDNSRRARMGADSLFGQRVTRRAVAIADELSAMARERSLTGGQLALLWCKDQPGITAPIIGPRTVEHLRDHMAVLDLRLDAEDAERIDALNGPGNAVSDFHNSNPWTKARILESAN
jgi:aryl-alcohol dehydrogenase-like predicted oxidoreductase